MLTAQLLEAADPAVRIAVPEDEDDLVTMVRRMHEDPEWPMRDELGQPARFSEHKSRAMVQRALVKNRNHPDAGQAWIGVLGDPGQLLGSAYVCVQERSMSDGFFLCEAWNYTLPEWRRGPACDRLLAFSTGMADMMHLSLVLAAMTQQRMAKSRLYERRIGQPIGALFHYTPVGV